jgi:hypothetical protein
MKKFLPLVIISVTLSLLPASAVAAETNPYGTSTVDPAGPNEIIFTISKGSKSTQFATSRLFKLKTSEITIYEPFLKKRQTFSVIPISTFFKMVGIKGNDQVLTTALNDYVFKAKASQFIAAGALIAIKRDGKEISYDQGGPIRIIFGSKSTWAKYLDAWNWSLSSITVK